MKSLEYAKHKNFNRVVILSDSLSVLLALKKLHDPNNLKRIHPHILIIKQLIYNLKTNGIEIQIVWVKAHVGILYNEQVDILAKESIHTGQIVEGLCLSDCIKMRRSMIRKKWSSLWNEFCLTNPTRYTLIQPTISVQPWFYSYNIPRKYSTIISRIKFGHGCYPTHLHRIGILPSDACEHCNILGDLEHIFFGCSKHTDESNELYNNIINMKIETPFNLTHLLFLQKEDVINCIIQFLRKTNIKL